MFHSGHFGFASLDVNPFEKLLTAGQGISRAIYPYIDSCYISATERRSHRTCRNLACQGKSRGKVMLVGVMGKGGAGVVGMAMCDISTLTQPTSSTRETSSFLTPSRRTSKTAAGYNLLLVLWPKGSN